MDFFAFAQSNARREFSQHRAILYCGTCGEEYDVDAEHVCPCADDAPQWCELCGAELTDLGTCLNDHDE
jgi:hypothetical protein